MTVRVRRLLGTTVLVAASAAAAACGGGDQSASPGTGSSTTTGQAESTRDLQATWKRSIAGVVEANTGRFRVLFRSDGYDEGHTNGSYRLSPAAAAYRLQGHQAGVAIDVRVVTDSSHVYVSGRARVPREGTADLGRCWVEGSPAQVSRLGDSGADLVTGIPSALRVLGHATPRRFDRARPDLVDAVAPLGDIIGSLGFSFADSVGVPTKSRRPVPISVSFDLQGRIDGWTVEEPDLVRGVHAAGGQLPTFSNPNNFNQSAVVMTLHGLGSHVDVARPPAELVLTIGGDDTVLPAAECQGNT